MLQIWFLPVPDFFLYVRWIQIAIFLLFNPFGVLRCKARKFVFKRGRALLLLNPYLHLHYIFIHEPLSNVRLSENRALTKPLKHYRVLVLRYIDSYALHLHYVMMRIRNSPLTVMRIWIQVFPLMRIRVWTMLLIRVMQICHQWSTDPLKVPFWTSTPPFRVSAALHSSLSSLHCSWIFILKPIRIRLQKWVRIHANQVPRHGLKLTVILLYGVIRTVPTYISGILLHIVKK